LKTQQKLSKYPKYVVIDGNKVVQSIKVTSLGLNPIFKKNIIEKSLWD
tara:strand:- start:223 stop:366 length:144 start_codon:yes stop_codon:yes gene_type:complete